MLQCYVSFGMLFDCHLAHVSNETPTLDMSLLDKLATLDLVYKTT